MRELVIILACYIWLQRRWRASKTLRSAIFAIIILSVILIAIVGWETYLYLLLLGLQLLFGMVFMIVQFVAIFWFMSRPRIVTVRPGESSLTLDDYWGQPALIKLVSEWVTILRGDKKFDEMGGKPIKGVLLAGPPGCGKTFLVRTLAGTSGIALHAIEASSFRGMFWGMDVLRVLNFVSTARNLAAEHGSCIAYIDEIDSVGMSRGGVQGGAQVSSPVGMMGGGSGALTTLLAQIDGIEREREWTTCKNISRKWFGLPPASEGFVTFWGGTNRKDVLDPALVRPGRLSKTIQVDLPDGPGRRAIFDGYLNRITHGPINLDGIVINTQGATPALIENAVLQDAVRLARFRGADEVEQRDLESALTEQALGLANPIGDLPKEQRWQIAVHEAGHVVAVNHYAPEKRTAFVSIQRRGDSLGLTLPVNLEATYSLPLRRIAADICISLAGDIATEVVLGERWSGASADIEHIRQRINGLIYHGVFGGIPLSYKDVPPELYKKAGEWLEEQQDKVEAVLIKKKSQVEAIANALLEKDELSSQEIEAILEASKPQ